MKLHDITDIIRYWNKKSNIASFILIDACRTAVLGEKGEGEFKPVPRAKGAYGSEGAGGW